MHGVAHRFRDRERDFPIGHAVPGLHHLAHPLDAPFGVDEGSVLLEKSRAGQEHMRVMRRLAQEQVLHDHAFHRL